MSATNGSRRAAGLSAAHADDRRVDDRAERGQRHDEHDRGEDQREEQELDADPITAAAADARYRVPLPRRIGS